MNGGTKINKILNGFIPMFIYEHCVTICHIIGTKQEHRISCFSLHFFAGAFKQIFHAVFPQIQ